jgi:hypothetical protein
LCAILLSPFIIGICVTCLVWIKMIFLFF